MVQLVIPATEARVNITWKGQNGDLPDTVNWDSTPGDVKQWVTEAVRGGTVPNIAADPTADFSDYVVDRFPAPTGVVKDGERDYNLVQVRPKTPFG